MKSVRSGPISNKIKLGTSLGDYGSRLNELYRKKTAQPYNLVTFCFQTNNINNKRLLFSNTRFRNFYK